LKKNSIVSLPLLLSSVKDLRSGVTQIQEQLKNYEASGDGKDQFSNVMSISFSFQFIYYLFFYFFYF